MQYYFTSLEDNFNTKKLCPYVNQLHLVENLCIVTVFSCEHDIWQQKLASIRVSDKSLVEIYTKPVDSSYSNCNYSGNSKPEENSKSLGTSIKVDRIYFFPAINLPTVATLLLEHVQRPIIHLP